MSIRTRRTIIKACITVAVITITLRAGEVAGGLHGSVIWFVLPAVTIVSGLVFLCSTRGRS